MHAAQLLLLCTWIAPAQDTLSPDAMQNDLFQLSDALHAYHPGFHRYTDVESFEDLFAEAVYSCEEPRTRLDFYRQVSELVARIGCGHTSADYPAADRLGDVRGFLPLEVFFDGEGLWVLRDLREAAGDRIEPGTRIVAIDGSSVVEIRDRVYRRISGDGAITTGKQRQLEREFVYHYLLHAAEPGATGDYEVSLEGEASPRSLAGVSAYDYEQARGERPRRPLIELRLVEQGSVGILSIASFGDRREEAPFLETLEASFRELAAKEVSGLVLDLRGNGGGDDMYGATLVSYLADRPFGYFERIEVTEAFDNPRIRVIERDGMRLNMSHPGLREQAPAEAAFQGEVLCLIDGWTFSTAADVATVAHHNGFAEFVGEETGGGYDGNTSGQSDELRLGSSRIAVNLPLWMYTTANVGHRFQERGVIPTYPLRPTIEDVLAGRDVELEFAVARLRKP